MALLTSVKSESESICRSRTFGIKETLRRISPVEVLSTPEEDKSKDTKAKQDKSVNPKLIQDVID